MQTVRIASGLVSGAVSADGLVHAFKGIPYAKPPLGARRWRAPEPPEPWDGVRRAENFGPSSLQPSRLPNSVAYFGREAQSEDCLYLNVWTAARSGEERRPVMMWIHGGAFYLGSGSLPIFQGEALARKGAVVVTVNYRLGRLGFLAHPQLTKESQRHASGNYGWLDLIAALRWVQVNIGAFGGDPDNVTIFGQSAGSTTINAFMTSPQTRGLFHRAIGQSGGALGPPGRPGGSSMLMLDAAEKAGWEFCRALGTSSIDELRSRPAEDIQLVRPEAGWTIQQVLDPSKPGPIERETAWAIIDGDILPEPPHGVFIRGAQHDVPLLTGANSSEGAMFAAASSLAAFTEQALTEFGGRAESFLAQYPARDDAEAAAASRAARGDQTFVAQNWLWARLHARSGRRVFHYRFERPSPAPEFTSLGAFHGAEIPYVFGTLDAREWPWPPSDRDLADTISSYWLNFSATGDPNAEGLPQWPRFDESQPATMIFGEYAAPGAMPKPDLLAFWDAHRSTLAERMPAA